MWSVCLVCLTTFTFAESQQSGDVRLRGSGLSNAGRVEIYYGGQWGTVCDDSWDINDARVVCRQLGYAAASKFRGNAFYGQGTGRIWMDQVGCTGREFALSQCRFDGWGVQDCAHTEDAGVVCSGVSSNLPDIIRLVGGASSSEGRVEIRHNGQWGTVCDDRWDINDAHVVCQQLGYSGALSFKVGAFHGQGSGPIWMDEVHCRGTESALNRCSFANWGVQDCTHREDAGVVCNSPTHRPRWITTHAPKPTKRSVRLVGGSSNEGRVEVYYRGQWGTVCDHQWNLDNAHVVCRQLGYSGASHYKDSAYYGQGSGPIWMDEVHCSGNEAALSSCRFLGWGIEDCSHSEDVGVACTGSKNNDTDSNNHIVIAVAVTVPVCSTSFIVLVLVIVVCRRERARRSSAPPVTNSSSTQQPPVQTVFGTNQADRPQLYHSTKLPSTTVGVGELIDVPPSYTMATSDQATFPTVSGGHIDLTTGGAYPYNPRPEGMHLSTHFTGTSEILQPPGFATEEPVVVESLS